MPKKEKTPYFYISVSGLISLSILTILTIIQDYSFLEELAAYAKIFEICLYIFCITLGMISLFFPYKQKLYYIALSSLATWDIIKGDEITAILLFFILVILLTCNGFFFKRTPFKITGIFLFWISLFILTVLLNNIDLIRVLYFCTISLFSLGAFTTIILLLKQKLKNKKDLSETSSNKLELKLAKLTERQYNCLVCILNNKQYKEIASELNISVSTVKLEVARLLKTFESSNKTELKELFSNINLKIS